jgi:sporulation protein YlmC with PRC-barrel domain
MRVSKLNGMKVITANAYVLGEVEGAEVDTNKWKVTHLDVSLTNEATKELGFKKPFLGSMKVCLPITIIKEFGNIITLKKSLQELKNLDECKVK